MNTEPALRLTVDVGHSSVHCPKDEIEEWRISVLMVKVITYLLLVAFTDEALAQFSFTTNNGTLTVTGYNGPNGIVVLPAETNGLPVTSIGEWALSYSWGVTDFIIPQSITNIGDGAFGVCFDLTTITVEALNPAYSSLAGVLFDKSQRKLVQCPGGKVGSYAVPSSVETIGSRAFLDCNQLTSISVSSTTTNIGPFAFAACTSLEAITVDGLNSNYRSAEGVLFDRDMSTLIQCPGGRTGSYIVPAMVGSIGDAAFSRCFSLTGVTIPDSVTSIGSEAFQDCTHLATITVGKNLNYIGPWAFWGCASLSTITLPRGVSWVGGFAFLYCTGLTGVYFNGNAPLDTGAFDYADNVFVYYLPGTTGWSATFGGRPTRLWQPEIALGVQTNRFGFDITWAEGMTVVVETATNPVATAWLPLQTNTLTAETFYFADPAWTNYPSRFYRVRWP